MNEKINSKANAIVSFVKNWTLPISMISGASVYFVYHYCPCHELLTPFLEEILAFLQPSLVFCMLYVTFCKVEPDHFKLRWWHLWLMIFQVGSLATLATISSQMGDGDSKIIIESAMLCLICPTATAAAVVTDRLGGRAETLVTYTMISNLCAALFVPVFFPLSHQQAELTFVPALLLILLKVFPLLIFPLLAAMLTRKFLPALHSRIVLFKDLAFYLWAVSLALAIAVSVKSLVHSDISMVGAIGMAIISMICCIIQFALGKSLGGRYGERISGGQALGQKNTVLIIWMGYTFLTPVTAVAGGFYSIWHNVINSYQLYRKRVGNK